ncbi:hypothetical protein PPROV_000584800 [Pycnococcus provasolii]|uniref:Uncharacterized protein n=1 Tax=Pycnococcus provasolii TaxID=41880 RepID=A0A830HK82_9CHLO|nr:hypothetical protein PPROV_000584800 [Pycnococcus provasolii]
MAARTRSRLLHRVGPPGGPIYVIFASPPPPPPPSARTFRTTPAQAARGGGPATLQCINVIQQRIEEGPRMGRGLRRRSSRAAVQMRLALQTFALTFTFSHCY